MTGSSLTSESSSINLSRGSSIFSVDFSASQAANSELNAALKSIDVILSSQTSAISHLTNQYRKSKWSIDQMRSSLMTLNDSLNRGGKIVISGMGKSFKIATKTVATLNSLGLHSAAIHPSEALHGDLGMIREDHNDSLIIISASGNSPELETMLKYVPISVPIILVTCTKVSNLSQHMRVSSVLYAELPSHLNEKSLYGLSAPTISTTLCLTLLDAVSISLSELNIKDINLRKTIFGSRHPGGAIGQNYQKSKSISLKESPPLSPPVEKSSPETASDNEDVEDVLNIDTKLITLRKKVQESKFVKLSKLPIEELEFLRIISLYDYLLVAEDDKLYDVIEAGLARRLYREYNSEVQNASVSEILWRIHESSLGKLNI